MKLKFLVLSGLVSVLALTGCAGSSNGDDLEVPTNLPPICRDIDFVAQPDMREMCGVRKVHNKAYRNIAQQRYLIKPSETSIVKKNNSLELRFQNSMPIILDGPIVNEIQFNQDKRLEKIVNTYDYHEIYSKTAGRMRIFKMVIPTDVGTRYEYCFRIPEMKGNSRTRSVAMGNNIEFMNCRDFQDLVDEYKKPKK